MCKKYLGTYFGDFPKGTIIKDQTIEAVYEILTNETILITDNSGTKPCEIHRKNNIWTVDIDEIIILPHVRNTPLYKAIYGEQDD